MISLIQLHQVLFFTCPSRYSCGSAREFLADEGSVPTQAMTCQWNRTWTPTHILKECEWVACLKPPTPPAWSNLRINDWDGKPVAFGDLAHYVCDRGMMFEEDPEQLEVTYSCQDGSDKQFSRGFFNVPLDESEWPRCLRGGILLSIFVNTNFFSPTVSNATRHTS